MKLKCVVCEIFSNKDMAINQPCGCSGCSTCILDGSICYFCKKPVQKTIPNPLLEEVECAPKSESEDEPAIELTSEIQRCSTCSEDASDYCYSCGQFYCENKKADHCGHNTVDIFGYATTPPVVECLLHKKPISRITFSGKLICGICDGIAESHLLEISKEGHQEFNGYLIEAAQKLAESIKACLEVGRDQMHQSSRDGVALGQTLAEKKIEQECKILECELMGLEDRILSLEAVSRLKVPRFLSLVTTYSESLASAMGISFSGVSRGGKTVYPLRVPSICIELPHKRETRTQKVRLFDLQVANLTDGRVICYDLRRRYSWSPPIDDPVIDIASHGDKLAVLIKGKVYVFSGDKGVGPILVNQTAISISVGEHFVYVACPSEVSCYDLSGRRAAASHSWSPPKKKRISRIYRLKDYVLVLLRVKTTILLHSDLILVDKREAEDNCPVMVLAVDADDFSIGAAGVVARIEGGVGCHVEPSTSCSGKCPNTELVSCDVSSIYPLAVYSTSFESFCNFF